MNKDSRKFIPQSVQRELLFKNEAVCCVCQKQTIQIHHIDGDSKNNKLSNLAVLCVEHHALASSNSSIAKGFTPALIKKFKNDWESRIARKRGTFPFNKADKKDKIEEQNIKFELKKLIYYIPTLKTKKAVNDAIDKIYHWHMYEGYEKYIFERLTGIHWFFSNEQIRYISKRIYEFYWHLVGPEDVPFRQSDKKSVSLTLELLGSFGIQIALLDDKEDVLTIKSVLGAFDDLFDIISSYKSKELKRLIIKELKNVKKEWMKSDIKQKNQPVKLLNERIEKYNRKFGQPD